MRRRLNGARPFSRSHLRDRFDVLGRGTTAAAHEIQPAVIDKLFQLRGEGIRRFSELAFRIRKPGIGITRNTKPRHFMQTAYVVRHQIRTRGTIHSHGQQIVVRDGGIQRINRLPAQHGAVAFNGDRCHHRNRQPQIAAQLLHRQQRGFETPGVETSLDQQKIGAAFHQSLGLFIISIVQLRKSDGGCYVQILVSRTHGTSDEARLG